MPRLENWSIGSFGTSLYQAPELWQKQLYGEIYDDEAGRFPDGSHIQTSSIQSLDLANNVAHTRNTRYILGKPSEDYLKWLEDNGMSLEQFVK